MICQTMHLTIHKKWHPLQSPGLPSVCPAVWQQDQGETREEREQRCHGHHWSQPHGEEEALAAGCGAAAAAAR